MCSDIPDTHDDPVHPSVQLVRDHYNNPLEATLEDCIDWHTKDERVIN